MKSQTSYDVEFKYSIGWLVHPLANGIQNFDDSVTFKNRAKKAGIKARVVEITTTRKIVSK